MSTTVESDAERFLTEAHRQAPGMTSRAFSVLRDPRGRTSYALLAQQAAACEPHCTRVLDVACGDGFLLERIRDAAPLAELSGVDLSEEELALAKARLPTASLVCGRAQTLPFESGSFDLVTCHMAFMLFDSVEAVVDELSRVLAPGGALGLVVGARPPEGSPLAHYASSFKSCFSGFGATMPSLGGRRTRSPDGLRALLEPRFRVTSVEPHHVSRIVPLADVWSSCEDLYNHALLGPEDRARLAAHLLASLSPDPEGRVVDVHAVNHVVGVRRTDEFRQAAEPPTT